MNLISNLCGEDKEQSVYDHAALDKLGFGWFINGVMGDVPQARTAAMRSRIAEKKEWVATLKDPRWRSAFTKWLDHADYCCDQADKYREARPAWDADCKRMEQERRNIDSAARQLPPPR